MRIIRWSVAYIKRCRGSGSREEGRKTRHGEGKAVIQLRPANGCIGVPHQDVEDRQGLGALEAALPGAPSPSRPQRWMPRAFLTADWYAP